MKRRAKTLTEILDAFEKDSGESAVKKTRIAKSFVDMTNEDVDELMKTALQAYSWELLRDCTRPIQYDFSEPLIKLKPLDHDEG